MLTKKEGSEFKSSKGRIWTLDFLKKQFPIFLRIYGNQQLALKAKPVDSMVYDGSLRKFLTLVSAEII